MWRSSQPASAEYRTLRTNEIQRNIVAERGLGMPRV